ncbi:hypothetical protein H0H92_006546 [Tricholoma furcatifolium]|nr:hypothetical protein H0H92_006546 [Tricholoma furcatifolium]
MDGVGGRKGWECRAYVEYRIFILEGLLTVAVSLAAYFIVPTWSHSATFLTEPERERLLARLNSDSDAGKKEEFQWHYVLQAFKDPVVWGYALLFHGYAFVLYSLSLFLGSDLQAGKLNCKFPPYYLPPYAFAAISIIFTVWASSHINLRAPFIIGAAVFAIIGYLILITAHTPGAQYLGVHFATAGVYTGNALLLSWPGENVSSQTKRAVAVAMQITIGDIGAIVGPTLSANHYRTPHAIAIGYLTFAIIITAILATWLKNENRRRDEILSSGGEEEFYTPAQQKALQQGYSLGDRDLQYRYVY